MTGTRLRRSKAFLCAVMGHAGAASSACSVRGAADLAASLDSLRVNGLTAYADHSADRLGLP